MKQYTTPDQTVKLIELGFEKPNEIYLSYFDSPKDFKSTNVIEIDEDGKEIVLDNYSIGELIEILPDEIYIDEIVYSKVIDKTNICYYSWAFEIYAISICDVQEELVDNLYDMIIKLKVEGVI